MNGFYGNCVRREKQMKVYNPFRKKNKKSLELVWAIPPETAPFEVKPMQLQRDWMDKTNLKYAYRCLPLNIANQHGWAIYPKKEIVVRCKRDDRLIQEDIVFDKNPDNLALSHFGYGTLTFSMHFTPRVAEGYSLWIGGAPNHFINGITPMTGLYEADWGPFSATMNWKFTRKNFDVKFTPNDPFCFMFPIKRSDIEEFEMVNIMEKDYPDKAWVKQHQDWNEQRKQFGEDLKTGKVDGWQKHYFQGKMVDGTKCPYSGADRHRTKLDLSNPGTKLK